MMWIGRLAFAVGLGLLAAAPAVAQRTRWIIDPGASLAWWQINPHFGHLWATTCPDDPSWQAGESRSSSDHIDPATRKQTVAANRLDDRIPLYARTVVEPVCRDAITGIVSTDDPERWTNLNGTVTVAADSLVNGMRIRDQFARKAVFETSKYPYIQFAIDSVVSVAPSDTTAGTIFGMLDLHGVQTAIRAPVRVWREAAGLRVLSEFTFPARDLTRVYGMSRVALGLGVGMRSWISVHAGVDLVLTEAPMPSQ